MSAEIIVAALGVSTAMAASLVGLKTYYSRAAEDRAKWLNDLSWRFYSEPSLKAVRIDFIQDKSARVEGLLEKRCSEELSVSEKDLLDEFERYLSFLELISHLYEVGRLGLEEVDRTFSWYLIRLRASTRVREHTLEFYAHVDSTIKDMQDYAIVWELRQLVRGKKQEHDVRRHLESRFGKDDEALHRLDVALENPARVRWQWRRRRAGRWVRTVLMGLRRAFLG